MSGTNYYLTPPLASVTSLNMLFRSGYICSRVGGPNRLGEPRFRWVNSLGEPTVWVDLQFGWSAYFDAFWAIWLPNSLKSGVSYVAHPNCWLKRSSTKLLAHPNCWLPNSLKWSSFWCGVNYVAAQLCKKWGFGLVNRLSGDSCLVKMLLSSFWRVLNYWV